MSAPHARRCATGSRGSPADPEKRHGPRPAGAVTRTVTRAGRRCRDRPAPIAQRSSHDMADEQNQRRQEVSRVKARARAGPAQAGQRDRRLHRHQGDRRRRHRDQIAIVVTVSEKKDVAGQVADPRRRSTGFPPTSSRRSSSRCSSSTRSGSRTSRPSSTPRCTRPSRAA